MQVVRGVLAFSVLLALVGGLPWALVHYLGSPVPGHAPTWADIQSALTAPMSESVLLDILAILSWCAWAVFVADTIRVIPSAIRAATLTITAHPGPRVTRGGPIHTLTTVLVTAVALALLPHRPPDTSSAPTAAAAANVTHSITTDSVVQAAATESARHRERSPTVVVRQPHDGVHDCLWRIAERELGDGARWPEIYHLNKNRRQADGRALTHPDLIYPGWILTLPHDHTDDTRSKPARKQQTTRPETPTAIPTAAMPSAKEPTQAPSTATPPGHTPASPTPPPALSTPDADKGAAPWGISLGPGVYVSVGLAAAISAALLAARHRRRRWYQPGSQHRADLPVAPVVRALHIAHHLQHASPGTTNDDAVNVGSVDHPTPPRAHHNMPELAHHRGLGLVGHGADSAARALVLDLLTTTGARVLIPRDDARRLFNQHEVNPSMLAALRVVPDLDAALDELETEILRRTRRDSSGRPAHVHTGPLTLIAAPQPSVDKRLQAVLDNGSSLGIAGIVLGQWRPGSTVHIREDGIVTAANPAAEHLVGSQMFALPAPQAADLLTLLNDTADPADPDAGVTHDTTAVTPADQARPSSPSRHSDPSSSPAPRPERHAHLDPVPLTWSILGSPTLTWRHHGTVEDLTTALTPRQRELLVLLAIHPDGLPRDALADTLWPHGPTHRPANALHTTLSRLRRTLHDATSDDTLSGVVTTRADHYLLNPAVVDVDYWHLTVAGERARAAATETDRVAADKQVLTAYTGELAAGLSAEWLDVHREAARRDALDATARLARALIDTDPHQALRVLEKGRSVDPYNEPLHRDIMRLQARLGRHAAISHTLTLLTTRLADLDEHPHPSTIALAHQLQHQPPKPLDNHASPNHPPATEASNRGHRQGSAQGSR